MPFFIRDDLSTADIAFEARGRTREELFSTAWDALLSVMIKDNRLIRKAVFKEVALEDKSLSMLFLTFLTEAVFYKDAEGLFLLVEEITITEHDGSFSLSARLAGEPIDRLRHELGTDVKAVTLHQFQFEETDQGFMATVVLDI